MISPVVFSGALTLLAVISSGSAAVISPSNPISQNHQLPSNLSIPGRLTTENVRFGIRGHFGEENLNIVSLLMNTVNGLANLAHQPSQKRIPGFHVDILARYANIDISIQPVSPARDIEVQVAVDALYYSLYNMIVNKVFKNAAFDILWDGNVVGQMKIDKAGGQSQTVNGVSNASRTTTEQNTLASNDTTAVDLTANTRLLDGELSLYYHYPPNGERMSFQEVFVTLMAALKNLGRFPSTQVVEPFRTGARGFNARMQFFGGETPRTEPPFLTYALLIDTVRQIPFYMVDRKKFAELQTVITFDDVLLGEAILERGSPELGEAGTCENSSECDVSSN